MICAPDIQVLSGAYNRDGVVTVESNGVLLRFGRQDFPVLLHELQRELCGRGLCANCRSWKVGCGRRPKRHNNTTIERENRSGNEHSNQ